MSSTSERLLALLSLLQARRDWPGRLLAERLEVSPRTVRRDVDRLRELGYPIGASRGRDGGYRMEAGTHLPPLLFDDDQAVALVVALQLAAAGEGAVAEAAVRALATVRQVLPARLRHRTDALDVTAVPSPAARDVDPAVLLALAEAVRATEVLRVDLAEHEDGPPRRIEPHHVVHRGGRWYLLAWDLDRDDWRTFRVDRLRLRTPNGPRFVPRPVPGGDVAAFVSGRFKGSRDGDAWPCRGEVVLHRPAAELAPFVRDGVLEDLGDDRCRLSAGSWSWTALAADLLRYDADLEVLGPEPLREAFAALGRRCCGASAQGENAGQEG